MKKKNYNAPALDKGLDIIELLAVSSSEGLTQIQIANHLNKSVNEIYRMLATLKQRDYLDFDENTDRFKLSYKLLNLASSFNPTKTLLEKATPIMKEIAKITKQSIHLSIYTAGRLLVIAQHDSDSPFNYHVTVGSTFDLLETSSGRVILTYQSEEERERRLQRRKIFLAIEKNISSTQKETISLEKKFSKKSVHVIKKNGCEVVTSLQVVGITNFSYPIFDNSGYAIAALTVPYLNRLVEKKLNIKKTSSLLEKYSKKLSADLGFTSNN